MIISKTPLRISLGGGGTDIPSYYRSSGGFLVAAAIDKYIYISVHDNFASRYSLHYSKIENTSNISAIKHPIFRQALSMLDVTPGIEISSLADIPAGTGLGSSGSFSVGLIKALYSHQRRYATNEFIASEACRLEIDLLKNPSGKQDQYIAAIGGLTSFEFMKDGSVVPRTVYMEKSSRQAFQDNLLLFYTGIQRSASEELAALGTKKKQMNRGIRENLDEVKRAGYQALELLEMGRLEKYAEQLTRQWKLKLGRAPTSVNRKIDAWINQGIEAGAIGGKLVGAGGGGFLLFYADSKNDLRERMSKIGLREVHFNFDYSGTALVSQ